MTCSWSLVYWALLTGLSVCCAIHPQQQQQHQPRHQRVIRHRDTHDSATQMPPSDGPLERNKTHEQYRAKRQTAECPVLETEGGSSPQEIANTSGETLNFFIQPRPGFNRLVFRMKVSTMLDKPWKYATETLDISSSRLNIDWTHPAWIQVRVEYFKNEKKWAKDRHALRVNVGEDVEEELLTDWWRTHTYEGFAVYAEGPLRLRFKCNPKNAVAESVKQNREETPILLILGAVGACFLVVLAAAIIYLLVVKCSRRSRDDPPPVPKFPKSLLLGRHTNGKNDTEPIYETIDDATLAKLRQNFVSETLRQPQDMKERREPSAKGFTGNTQALWNQAHSPGIFGTDAKGTLELSLLEEKAALRQSSDLASPVESHYVEMHGIVSRSSSLSQ